MANWAEAGRLTPPQCRKVLGFGLELGGAVRLAKEHGVKMAIVAVPAVGAQEVINHLVDAGVVGILNFAPIVAVAPEHVMGDSRSTRTA